MANPEDLPLLRQDKLIFQDTSKRPEANGIYPCLLCTKPFVMGVYIGEPDQTCGECREKYRDTARVICNKCRITIGRCVPKILDCGYYVRPRSVLHSSSCNVCHPGLKESTIIEIDQWIKQLRPSRIIVPMTR